MSKVLLAVRWGGRVVMKLNDLGLSSLLEDLQPYSVTCNNTKVIFVPLSFNRQTYLIVFNELSFSDEKSSILKNSQLVPFLINLPQKYV